MNLMTEQKKWYAKLRVEGFKDIENSQGILSGEYFFDLETQNYYILVGKFMHENTWYDEMDRLIWQLYSEGLFDTEIARICGVSRFKVERILKMYKSEFDQYVEEETNQKQLDY